MGKSETTKAQLLDDLAAMGIANQHVLVHSSYKLLAPVAGGPRTVLDALVEVVGSDGSLLLPTYDFSSWTERGYWDKENTPSQMGVISELARTNASKYNKNTKQIDGFSRTGHPVLSYAVKSKSLDYRRGTYHHRSRRSGISYYVVVRANPLLSYSRHSHPIPIAVSPGAA